MSLDVARDNKNVVPGVAPQIVNDPITNAALQIEFALVLAPCREWRVGIRREQQLRCFWYRMQPVDDEVGQDELLSVLGEVGRNGDVLRSDAAPCQ